MAMDHLIDRVQAWILANPLSTVGILCAIAIMVGYLTLARRNRAAPAPEIKNYPRM